MPLKRTAQTRNIHNANDGALETGLPVDVIRKNRVVRISPVEKKSKLANLKKRVAMKGDPESFVHIDWSGEWKP